MTENATRRARVAVIDDHPLFLLGLTTTLEVHGFEVAFSASEPASIDLVEVGGLDLVVLDVRMGPPGGIDVCRSLRALGCAAPIVMLTTFEEPVVRAAAAAAGANAYLSKDLSPDALVRAFRRVLDGATGEGLDVERFESLSRRELDVVRCLAQGATNKAIARRLGLSPETVKTYLAAVFRKLEVRDRTAAVVRARELGWLDAGADADGSHGQQRA